MTRQLEQDLYTMLKSDDGFIYGLTGNFNGDVDVPNKENYIYVRVNGLTEVVAVWNDFLPSTRDIQVALEPNPLLPEELKVVGVANQMYPGKAFPYTTIKKHGHTHTWPSYDTASIYHRQVIPLLVLRSSSNPKNVQVFPGYYKTPGGYGYYEGVANFSLTPYRPTTGARYVLLYLSSAGILSARNGTTKQLSTLTLDDAPSLMPDETGLAVVRLYVGQQKIRDVLTPQITDIVDIRYVNAFVPSVSSIVTGTFPYIDFDITGTYDSAEGRLKWNPDEGCLEVGMPGGAVNLQIGLENLLPRRVYNDLATTQTNGTLVYISGSTGNTGIVWPADNRYELTSANTIAMLTENIPSGQKGWATQNGIVRDLDTSPYPAGTHLWLGLSGTYTDTRPVAPNHAVSVGYVWRQHATEGEIFVVIQNGFELEELHDVLITGASDGNYLRYSGGVWRNTPGLQQTIRVVSGAYYEIQPADDVVVFLSAGTGLIPVGNNLNRTHRIANETDDDSVVLFVVQSGTYKGQEQTDINQYEDVIASCYGNGRWA